MEDSLHWQLKNWQEPFVHKWDTSLKVTDGFMKYCCNYYHTESTVA